MGGIVIPSEASTGAIKNLRRSVIERVILPPREVIFEFIAVGRFIVDGFTLRPSITCLEGLMYCQLASYLTSPFVNRTAQNCSNTSTALCVSLPLAARYGLTEVPRDSCFLRSKPYLDLVERTMSQLVQWGRTEAVTAIPDSTVQASAASASTIKSAGFGGAAAVGSGMSAKKGASPKKKKTKRK